MSRFDYIHRVNIYLTIRDGKELSTVLRRIRNWKKGDQIPKNFPKEFREDGTLREFMDNASKTHMSVIRRMSLDEHTGKLHYLSDNAPIFELNEVLQLLFPLAGTDLWFYHWRKITTNRATAPSMTLVCRASVCSHHVSWDESNLYHACYLEPTSASRLVSIRKAIIRAIEKDTNIDNIVYRYFLRSKHMDLSDALLKLKSLIPSDIVSSEALEQASGRVLVRLRDEDKLLIRVDSARIWCEVM